MDAIAHSDLGRSDLGRWVTEMRPGLYAIALVLGVVYGCVFYCAALGAAIVEGATALPGLIAEGWGFLKWVWEIPLFNTGIGFLPGLPFTVGSGIELIGAIRAYNANDRNSLFASLAGTILGYPIGISYTIIRTIYDYDMTHGRILTDPRNWVL